MVVFSFDRGYSIEFPTAMVAKLESLSDEKFDELRDVVEEVFPMIDGFYSDEIKFNDDFRDYRWSPEDKKREVQKLDRKLRTFINKWLKEKEAQHDILGICETAFRN